MAAHINGVIGNGVITKSVITDIAQFVPDANGPQLVYAGACGYCRMLASHRETVAKLESRGGVIVLPPVARLQRGEQHSIEFIDAGGEPPMPSRRESVCTKAAVVAPGARLPVLLRAAVLRARCPRDRRCRRRHGG